MRFLDRFRKGRQQSILPEEVEQYYKTERRQKSGVAILIGLVAVIVTVLIILALFFGGRFVINKITNKGDKNQQAQQEDWPVGNSQSNNKPANENSEASEPNQPTNNQPSNQAQPNNSNQPSTPPTPAQTPSLGDGAAMPRTGDEGR